MLRHRRPVRDRAFGLSGALRGARYGLAEEKAIAAQMIAIHARSDDHPHFGRWHRSRELQIEDSHGRLTFASRLTRPDAPNSGLAT
jgi:hypothetical protein